MVNASSEQSLLSRSQTVSQQLTHLSCAAPIQCDADKIPEELSNTANPCYSSHKVGQTLLRSTFITSGLGALSRCLKRHLIGSYQ
jgi:hypothetical protein